LAAIWKVLQKKGKDMTYTGRKELKGSRTSHIEWKTFGGAVAGKKEDSCSLFKDITLTLPG